MANKEEKKKKELEEKIKEKVALQRKVPALIKDEDRNVELEETYKTITSLSVEILALQIELRKK